MMTARSTAFFSSRTFPAQLCEEYPLPRTGLETLHLLSVLLGEAGEEFIPASSLMSPARSRSGGRNTSTTASR